MKGWAIPLMMAWMVLLTACARYARGDFSGMNIAWGGQEHYVYDLTLASVSSYYVQLNSRVEEYRFSPAAILVPVFLRPMLC